MSAALSTQRHNSAMRIFATAAVCKLSLLVSCSPSPSFFPPLSIYAKNRINFQAGTICLQSFFIIVFFFLFYLSIKYSCFPTLTSLRKDAGGKIFSLCLTSSDMGINWVSCSGLDLDLKEGAHVAVGLANRWK